MRSTATLVAEKTLLLISGTSQQVFRGEVGARDVVLTLVTAVEIYVDQILDLHVLETQLHTSVFGISVLNELGDSLHNSWANRYRWLRSAFEISVSGTSEQQNFDVLVELRNAVIHGGGTLTRRQSGEFTKRLRLEHDLRQKLDVATSNKGLIFGSSTASLSVSIARSFVIALDNKMGSASIAIRTSTL